jgi:hypothetical protein
VLLGIANDVVIESGFASPAEKASADFAALLPGSPT